MSYRLPFPIGQLSGCKLEGFETKHPLVWGRSAGFVFLKLTGQEQAMCLHRPMRAAGNHMPDVFQKVTRALMLPKSARGDRGYGIRSLRCGFPFDTQMSSVSDSVLLLLLLLLSSLLEVLDAMTGVA